MSAIAGIYHMSTEPINYEYGCRIMRKLEEFPSNDIQTWHNDKVFLGCHAQWITPESIGEKLPYYDSGRQIAITADAIIDNREELFEKLQIRKDARKAITDSELILLAYDRWGEDSPKHLLGDFAFIIWDQKNQKLFGARDPSGYRTLYFYHNSRSFVFCTTIEPLFTVPYIEKKLNEPWIAEFLAISGMTDSIDGNSTPYQNIHQIPPFHSISITGNRVRISRYGSFYPEKKLCLPSNEEYVEAFQEVYQNAVKSRLRTCANVGSLLSGGLDSGSVVGFAAKALKANNKTLHTFSYIPPSDFVDYTPKQLMADERPLIKKTVNYAGGIVDHYEAFEGRSSFSEIDDILDAMEMPYKFAENSFWLKGMFEKANEQGIGILLNGDRGNFTVSWGSPLEHYATLLKKLKWIRLYHELDQYSRNAGGARLRRLPDLFKIGFPFINQIAKGKTREKPPMLINPEFAEKTGVFQRLKEHGLDESGWFHSSNIYEHRRILFTDLFPWNSGHTLNAKLSLRYALWKRDPTNDLRVVRFCLSIPEEQYVQNGFGRALIRRSTKNILPDEVRLNQTVRGVQGADWIHRMIPVWESFIKEVRQFSSDARILKMINGNVLQASLKKAEKEPQLVYSKSEYSLLMRSLIIYRFIQKFA